MKRIPVIPKGRPAKAIVALPGQSAAGAVVIVTVTFPDGTPGADDSFAGSAVSTQSDWTATE